MRAAALQFGGGWRLEGATIAVVGRTLHDVRWRAGDGAGGAAGVPVLFEPKTGRSARCGDVVRDRRLTHRPQVRGGVPADDCAALSRPFQSSARRVRSVLAVSFLRGGVSERPKEHARTGDGNPVRGFKPSATAISPDCLRSLRAIWDAIRCSPLRSVPIILPTLSGE